MRDPPASRSATYTGGAVRPFDECQLLAVCRRARAAHARSAPVRQPPWFLGRFTCAGVKTHDPVVATAATNGLGFTQ